MPCSSLGGDETQTWLSQSFSMVAHLIAIVSNTCSEHCFNQSVRCKVKSSTLNRAPYLLSSRQNRSNAQTSMMAAQVRTAFDLWRNHEQDTVTLSSGCSSIDEAMQGGFRNGMVTEICGEASAGKTQLSLQLLLQCCLPKSVGGLGATACYISTESIGSIKRLHDLASAYHAKYNAVLRKRKRDEIGEGATFFLDKIFIEQIYEVEALVEFMQMRLPTLLASQKTKLVVIDSIAAVFRSEATTSVKEASDRSRLMFHLANCMRILSAQFQAIFVVTNQVTGNISEGISFTSDRTSQIKPALGMSWSNCINQRLMLYRMRRGAAERRVEVVMSPYLPRSVASFQVTSAGITPVGE